MAGQPQRIGEWRHHFPVGATLQMGATAALPNPDGSSTATQCNNVAGLASFLTNPTSGLLANNLRYVLLYLGSPWFHEAKPSVAPGLLATLEANQRGGNTWGLFQTMGQRLDLAVDATATGLTTEFTGTTTVPIDTVAVPNTRTVADPKVATVVSDLSGHPSLLAYMLGDDVDGANGAQLEIAARNQTLVASFAAQDPHGRPSSPTWRYNAAATDLKLNYGYPCTYSGPGATAGGEGDFHNVTYATKTGITNADLPDFIRYMRSNLAAGARDWWFLQCHATSSGGSSRLREPTTREMRTMFWLHVGEGSTGLFWFIATDNPGGSTTAGLCSATQTAKMAVAHELSDRLTPSIRKRLLGCTPAGASTAFTASGGGSSGLAVDYATAYVGGLTHADGTTYVVVANRGTATANVTVSHPTLGGYLLSLETGARYKLGADAIPLAPLDGTILVHEPAYGGKGRRGVPAWDVDLGQSVETWWGAHWANPSSVNYISSGAVALHANVVGVPVGADLQAYVDAAPDYTTFSLASGAVYAELTLIERSHLHFTSANPSNKAKIARIRIYGSTYAQQYNSDTTVTLDYGFVAQLYSVTDASLTSGGGRSIRAQARKRWLSQPSQDIIFDQIAFDATATDAAHPVAQPVVYYKLWQIGDDNPQTDHWYEGAPVGMRVVRDVLVQRCTFNNYKWGSDNGSQASPAAFAISGNVPAENNTGPVSHPGLIWGNAGIRNVVVRDNTFTLATNGAGTGSPSACFFDGAQGMVAYNNTLAGKQNQDSFNFLINDDYTADLRLPGMIDAQDKRMGRFVVVAGNTLTTTGSPTIVSFSGEKLLVKGNTLNGVPTGTVPTVVILSSKSCRLATTQGVYYECYDSVIDGNAITANAVTTFVQYNVVNAYTPGLTYASPVRSRLGRATIKSNVLLKNDGVTATTITDWSKEDAASVTASALIDVDATIIANNVNDTATGRGIGSGTFGALDFSDFNQSGLLAALSL